MPVSDQLGFNGTTSRAAGAPLLRAQRCSAIAITASFIIHSLSLSTLADLHALLSVLPARPHFKKILAGVAQVFQGALPLPLSSSLSGNYWWALHLICFYSREQTSFFQAHKCHYRCVYAAGELLSEQVSRLSGHRSCSLDPNPPARTLVGGGGEDDATWWTCVTNASFPNVCVLCALRGF